MCTRRNMWRTLAQARMGHLMLVRPKFDPWSRKKKHKHGISLEICRLSENSHFFLSLEYGYGFPREVYGCRSENVSFVYYEFSSYSTVFKMFPQQYSFNVLFWTDEKSTRYRNVAFELNLKLLFSSCINIIVSKLLMIFGGGFARDKMNGPSVVKI